MNKYTTEILKSAYEQYQKTHSPHCSIQFSGSANDLVAYHNAVRNLSADGYIENLVNSGLSVTFDISAIRIEYMRVNGKL